MFLFAVDVGVYLHDPATLIAAIDPSLFTFVEGVVRVQTTGITRGLTIFDNQQKKYEHLNPQFSSFMDSFWCNIA